MSYKHLLAFLLSLYIAFPINSKSIDLRYKDGHFKIAQLTDIHWDSKSSLNQQNRMILSRVLTEEKPDLAIVTGDVVTAQPARKGWEDVVDIFEQTNIPFTVTMGNHDYEEWPEDSIYALLSQCPLFVGEKGPNHLTGTGNHVLQIKASNGSNEIKSLLYLLDSNAYTHDFKLGHYDWIHQDQINWYRNESQHYTKFAGKPLPSLAFFHIALPEYELINNKKTTFGSCNEGSGAPRINSGMFSQFVECQDVMGVFVGHDHDNDYIGQHFDIALAYGRVSGLNAYGSLERGVRLISLYEDEKRFDTWITTSKGKEPVYYYPSGVTTKAEAEADYMKAVQHTPLSNGISYVYYEGSFSSTDQFLKKGKRKDSGTISNFSITHALQDDQFGFDFNGLIQIPERGIYTFGCFSDDGSQLYIDGKLVVDNNGSHSAELKKGTIALEEGFHDIQLLYFEDCMGQELKVTVSSKNVMEQPIPDEWLFVKK